MRVITLNVNGLRAAVRKGFFDWLESQAADVVCVQETKAQEHQINSQNLRPKGYCCYYLDAVRKGYSGVGIFTRREPDKVTSGLGSKEFDAEARFLEARFDKLSIISLYMPSGSSSDARQEAKFRFMELFQPILQSMRRKRRDYIICGDWNIAHKEIDLKNWRANRKNSGFLPEERAWMDELFGRIGFVDAFRVLNQEPEQYTWWSNRGRAWEKNVGWRIDYQVISPRLRNRLEAAWIFKDQRFSDHAPLIIDYAIPF